MIWKYIPPEDFTGGAKPRTLETPPAGAVVTGSNSPYDTIQVVGKPGAKVPPLVSVDLGFADIEVLNGRQIRFTGEGLQTDVGARIAGPTRGMSVGADGGGTEELDATGNLPVSRPLTSKKQPPRKSRHKARRDDDFSDLTSLKGFRF